MKTYDKFNDINGGVGGAKSGDSQVEATSEELFGLFLTLLWEVRIDTSAAVHRYSPTAHAPLSLSLSPPVLLSSQLHSSSLGFVSLFTVFIVF